MCIAIFLESIKKISSENSFSVNYSSEMTSYTYLHPDLGDKLDASGFLCYSYT